jgi:hypothetical protein
MFPICMALILGEASLVQERSELLFSIDSGCHLLNGRQSVPADLYGTVSFPSTDTFRLLALSPQEIRIAS